MDARKPLGPLDPRSTDHLNKELGPPRSWVVGCEGDRDIHASAWLVGKGEVRAPHGTAQRGTTVEILLTPGGMIITNVCVWTRSAKDDGTDSCAGNWHETPQAALDWLIANSKGRLGPASKQAWSKFCRTVPGLSGLEFQQID